MAKGSDDDDSDDEDAAERLKRVEQELKQQEEMQKQKAAAAAAAQLRAEKAPQATTTALAVVEGVSSDEEEEEESSSSGSALSGESSSSGSDSEEEDSNKQKPEYRLTLPENSPGSKTGAVGMKIVTALMRRGGNIVLFLAVQNQSNAFLQDFALQINRNSFGLAPGNTQQLEALRLAPGGSGTVFVQILPNVSVSADPPGLPLTLELALKNSLDLWYMKLYYDLSCLLIPNLPLSGQQFLRGWAGLEGREVASVVRLNPADSVVGDPRTLSPAPASQIRPVEKFARRCNFIVIGSTLDPNAVPSPFLGLPPGPRLIMRLAGCTTNRLTVFAEVQIGAAGGVGVARIAVRTEVPTLIPLVQQVIEMKVLRGKEGGGAG